ncbi:phosphoribosylanthranilate isomerase [Mameliella sediminis]|uniref:phosphoribosylanthranilate isomerase n=1 Tax=Mameliella sediminis TaxID=2836866 RepID=UPI001C47C478|nr:phosphoribosylanthranilate isomerase [Mameliella sediminis]MBV7394666.1 phosphoribosylanthranilate isomerase [Mameliella sediminis]
MVSVRIKICGLTRPGDMEMVAAAGASYGGLVFFPKSPRNVTIEAARALALEAPVGLAKVALVVNPTDELLDRITSAVPLDMIQLHGSEPPERVAEVRARYGLPVMKAVGVAEEADLQKLVTYQQVADQILVDAKPPKSGVLPGGNGLAFDWRLIAGRRWSRPWMLAGGLTSENVGRAIAMTGAVQVDLSSGVESAPGVKDASKVAAFVAAAREAEAVPRL